MVTKLSSEFVQSSLVSSAPVVAEMVVSERLFRITSPPFNPTAVSLDDLLKTHDMCSYLIVAFELSSATTFMADFTTWLNVRFPYLSSPAHLLSSPLIRTFS